ncbi:protein KTI12 homolog isoform X2 [Daktulosphaira vitifoliae]|uniref:protein KTI12 homolog isoform X2 n=1 Tax=Daktulosphaira vitifoliae TaxID=58002 RepID=UPI0021A9D2F4|nr:protein KTI12 homolog isoform X2 [Daktulosphaira vitifoliae]
MPLILMVGLPSSGKTTRAYEIKNFFLNTLKKNVFLISDNEIIAQMGMDKNVLFLEMKKEKQLRSILHSETLKKLTKDNVVILDSGNFIKGFRYELYCSSKSLSTPQCLVVCDISPARAWQLNENRPESDRYLKSSFDDLLMRYEEPNHSNRWDSPLINLQLTDKLPAEDIRKAIFEVPDPKPNLATINSIIQLKKQGIEGVNIEIPNYNGKFLNKLDNNLTLIQLAKSRRQFLSYAKSHPSTDDTKNIVNLFIQFLNNTLTC